MSTATFSRMPPQNLEAERALIGSLMLSPELFDELPIDLDDGAHGLGSQPHRAE